MGYTAFISYSHAEDHTLAAALESALLRFAWPVPGETAMRLFRDSSSLSATPELWPTIQKALDESEFLLLIASEEAARSVWVRREVQHWRTRGGAGRLLIALAGGAIVWHAGREDFDLTRSTALPSSIAGAFATEPLYVDFSTVLPRHYDLNHPAFCDKVATIASSLRGVTKDMLFGIHISRRLATEAARLSAEAELALRDGLPERSLMLGATALRLLDDRGQPRSCAAESIVRSALRRFGGRPLGSLLSAAIEPPLAFDNNGRWLVTIDTSGRTSAFELHGRTTEGKRIALDHDGPVAAVEFTADGGWLVSQWISSETGAAAGRTIRLWNAPSGFAEWHDVTAPEGKAFAIAVLSAERTHLAAGCDDGTIRVWDLEKGAGGDPLVVLDAGDTISHLACAARQHRVAALTADGSLYVWDLGDDQPAGTHSKIPLPESARIFHLAFSPDARWLLCRGETSLLV